MRRGSVDRSGEAGRGAAWTLRRFAQDDGGSVTVEMVLWLPFIFGLLMIIIDTSLAFFGRAQAFRVVQDFNRMVSVGTITGASTAAIETTAEAEILEAFEGISPNAEAEVTIANGFVSTVMNIPASDLILFSGPFLLASFEDTTMTVGAQHYLEWPN